MEISNIDDVLMSGKNATQPASPEHQEEPAEIEEVEQESSEYSDEPEQEEVEEEESGFEQIGDESRERPKKEKLETDEYGNTKAQDNEVIRDRLKQQARKFESEIADLRSQLAQQGASREVQQATRDFEYNPDESGDWQQQLKQFVKQTVSSMNQEQIETQRHHEERQLQVEFESKFRNGMNNFNDFVDVMDSLPFEITNHMTVATRAMNDPAAFLYAAAKQQPKELERISRLRDPYAQMTEMGRLEERMRKNKPTTKAPRPLGRTNEDASMPVAKKTKDTTIEDLIVKSEAKKLATLKLRRGSR